MRERFDAMEKTVMKYDHEMVLDTDAIIFAESEVKRERARIVAWLRGAPDRMAEQAKIPGITSIGVLYDAGQLAACKETADCIEQGKDAP